MDKALPNFSNANEALHAESAFFARVADVCDGNAAGSAGRDAQFLQYIAERMRELAASLQTQRAARAGSEARRFVQYTPERSAPGHRWIEALERRGSDVEHTRETLQQACEQWMHIHSELKAASLSPEAAELHEGCCRLLQRVLEELTMAFVQREDL